MERCSVADDGRVGGLKLIAVFGCQEAVSSMGEWLSVIQEREAMQAVALAGAPQQAGASRL
jgi:hypothetical protein